MGWLNWGVGYLVLRELPLKNFYARSIIMTWFALEYINLYGFPNIHGQLVTKPLSIKTGALFEKERRIFHWFNETDHKMVVNKNGNLLFSLNLRCQ